MCLNAIEQRSRRVLPVDFGPAADPHDAFPEPVVESVWIEPYPDAALGVGEGLSSPEAGYELRESVELAFVAALQHLPANQRAVLILREVLGFSAREVAGSLETTTASVNSALQRARRQVDERLPERSQQATLRELGDAGLRTIVGRYAEALEQGDVDAVVAMLTEDATWSMPPTPAWYRGHAAIVAFLEAGPMQVRWRHVATPRQRPAGRRLLRVGRAGGRLRRRGARRPDAARHADRRGHGVHRPRGLRPLRAPGLAAARPAGLTARSAPARRRRD